MDRLANPFTTVTDGTSLAVDTLPLLLPPFSGRVGFIHLGTIVDVGVWDFNNPDPRPTEFTIISVSFQAHAPGTVTMALLPPIGGKHLSNDGLPVAVELLTASVTAVDAVPLPASGLLLSSGLTLLAVATWRRPKQCKILTFILPQVTASRGTISV